MWAKVWLVEENVGEIGDFGKNCGKMGIFGGFLRGNGEFEDESRDSLGKKAI